MKVARQEIAAQLCHGPSHFPAAASPSAEGMETNKRVRQVHHATRLRFCLRYPPSNTGIDCAKLTKIDMFWFPSPGPSCDGLPAP